MIKTAKTTRDMAKGSEWEENGGVVAVVNATLIGHWKLILYLMHDKALSRYACCCARSAACCSAKLCLRRRRALPDGVYLEERS